MFPQGNGVYLGGLYIMRAQYEHAGLYTCDVESSSGSMQDSAQVWVKGKSWWIEGGGGDCYSKQPLPSGPPFPLVLLILSF